MLLMTLTIYGAMLSVSQNSQYISAVSVLDGLTPYIVT